MDASQITKLRQKQNTVYINRSQTVDASTMIWRNQIQYSKYIQGVATCGNVLNLNVPTQPPCTNNNGTGCTFGGQGRDIALSTGSTKRYPNVLASATGSASQVYSSDQILLQKAGRHLCAGLITDQDAYTILPKCDCTDTNGPTAANPTPPVNNNANPYLPPFDTHYKLKNGGLSTKPDANAKHFVAPCCK
jgi:hypothetical protein